MVPDIEMLGALAEKFTPEALTFVTVTGWLAGV
jgi:hypothetical protein